MTAEIVIATETSANPLLAEIQALSEAHWVEFAEDRERHELSVDLESYMRMYKTGKLLATTARRAGELVGYQLLIINRHPHRDVLALHDAITFIRPDIAARWLVLLRIVQHTVADGRRRGATYFRMRVKLEHDYGKLLARLGFRPVELAYALTVDGDDLVSGRGSAGARRMSGH